MTYIIAANALVILHLGFVCFVVLGGLLALRWRAFLFLHPPAAEINLVHDEADLLREFLTCTASLCKGPSPGICRQAR